MVGGERRRTTASPTTRYALVVAFGRWHAETGAAAVDHHRGDPLPEWSHGGGRGGSRSGSCQTSHASIAGRRPSTPATPPRLRCVPRGVGARAPRRVEGVTTAGRNVHLGQVLEGGRSAGRETAPASVTERRATELPARPCCRRLLWPTETQGRLQHLPSHLASHLALRAGRAGTAVSPSRETCVGLSRRNPYRTMG